MKVPKGVSLKTIANAISMNSSELEKINKHLKKNIPTEDSKAYNFYIPKSKLELYNKKIAIMKPIIENKKTKMKSKAIVYKVKKGDSFESIAKAHKISVKKLKSDNNKNSNLIKIGESIDIYK